MKRKKEKLFQWNLALSDREYRVESGENSVSSLMRECRIKDCLLADKDVLIAAKDKTIAEIVSANQGDVNDEIEVCWLFVLIYKVHVYRILWSYISVTREPLMTVGRSD